MLATKPLLIALGVSMAAAALSGWLLVKQLERAGALKAQLETAAAVNKGLATAAAKLRETAAHREAAIAERDRRLASLRAQAADLETRILHVTVDETERDCLDSPVPVAVDVILRDATGAPVGP